MFGTDFAAVQYLAGSISSFLFATGALPMVFKAFRTKSLKSYSLGNIGLSNLGNFLYWIYIMGLPFGPVWFLHLFNTATTLLMLLLYLRYEKGCRISGLSQCSGHFPACLT